MIMKIQFERSQMKHRITNILLAMTATAILMCSTALASETRQPGPVAATTISTESKMAYRYYYPASGCYYVKQCVRVNRWGKCAKFRWIKKCGPRRVL